MATNPETTIPTTLAQVYRGRPGCGCGCRGTYATPTEAPRKAKNALRDVAAALADPNREGEAGVTGEVVYHETETRYVWLRFLCNEAALTWAQAHGYVPEAEGPEMGLE